MQEYIVQQTYLGGGATSQVEGGAVLADDAIKSKIENGYHSAEDEKGGDAEEDESEFNSGVSTAIHDECVDNVDILLDKLLETIGGGKALPRADSSGGSGSNEHHHLKQQRRLLQRKGMHKILARLLRSLRADYLETTGPRCSCLRLPPMLPNHHVVAMRGPVLTQAELVPGAIRRCRCCAMATLASKGSLR